MNILLLAVGSYGDVLPLVGLGRELRIRGYTVTLCTNDHFAQVARQADLHFLPVGSADEYDEMANNPNLWHPQKGWRLIMKQLASPKLRKAYRVLCQHIQPGKTALVSSTLGFAARLIQETHNVPHATVHFSPAVFHSAYASPTMPGFILPDWLPIWFKRGCWSLINYTLIDPILKPYLNAFRQELGLSPISKIFSKWAHSPELVLGMFPDWYAPPQPDWPSHTHLTGFPLYDHVQAASLPASIQTFLKVHPKPLVFTPGSANKQGKKFFREAAAACQALGCSAIFLTRYPEQLPSPIPQTIQHFSYVPLSQLLPHCAGLIHHGGIGTCSQAMRAGIPQVIQPLAFDQFDNGARMVRLGVGSVIPNRFFRGRTLATTLEHIMTNPRLHKACQTTFYRLQQNHGLAMAGDIIENHLISSIR